MTALMHAANESHLDVVNCLLKARGDISAVIVVLE